MNERIKELAEQAEAQYCDLGDASCFKRLGLVEAVVFKPEDLEKFAELIVQECANVVDSLTSTPGYGEVDCWAEGVDLLQHFGVEE